MLLLDLKDGKLWWKQYINGHWEFISEEAMSDYRKAERERVEKIAAKIYNDAFNGTNKS